MLVWIVLIVGSAFIGFLTAILVKNNMAVYLAGAIPWFVLLVAILFTEYFLPYQGGGASMWPIAQLVGGTIAAVVGVISFNLTRNYFNRNND